MENIKLMNYKDLSFYIREGTNDDFIVKENSYIFLNFNENDIWLDAGGNIGTFACKFANKVKQIISFEPDGENSLLFEQNVKYNNIANNVLYKKALVHNDDKIIQFYLCTGKNKATHSVIKKRGRDIIEVQCENINDIITKHNINKIKMDIEGAEYELIKNTNFEKIGRAHV